MYVPTYRVRRGESARSIGEKFSVPESAILRENPGPLYEGREITVPVDILRIPPESAKTAAAYYEVPESWITVSEDAAYILFL